MFTLWMIFRTLSDFLACVHTTVIDLVGLLLFLSAVRLDSLFVVAEIPLGDD
jgi:hypothetical protein